MVFPKLKVSQPNGLCSIWESRCFEGALRKHDGYMNQSWQFQVQMKLVQTKHTEQKFSASHHQLYHPASFSVSTAIFHKHRMGIAPEVLQHWTQNTINCYSFYAQQNCHRLPEYFLPGSAHPEAARGSPRLCKEQAAGRKRCPGVVFQHRPWHYAVCTLLKH